MEKKTFLDIATKYENSSTGDLGIYFKDLTTGEEFMHHAEAVYPAASVFKVFVLADLFRQIKEGRFTLLDRFPLKSEDKATGSGVLKVMDDDVEPTLKDYATLMMILSDNTAADFLFKLVGKENIVENVIRPLNLQSTKCDLPCSDLIAACFQIEAGTDLKEFFLKHKQFDLRNTPAFTGGLEENDETSPVDAGKMLELLYTGNWQGADSDAQELQIMKQCQTNGRIPKYLPKGTVVAHKTGTMDRVVNDVGIVYTPKGDYILSMFYNGNTASAEEYAENSHGFFGEELLAHISKDIYAAYVGG